jgi:hypothetical protein
LALLSKAPEYDAQSPSRAAALRDGVNQMTVSNSVAWILIAILCLLAALHLYWGFGGFWPARNEQELVGLVSGKTADIRMPSILECATVSLMMMAGASVLLLRHVGFWDWLPSWVLTAGHFVMTIAFLARGCITYFTALTQYAIGTPFYGLDRLYYAPFCLGMGCFLIIEAATRTR